VRSRDLYIVGELFEPPTVDLGEIERVYIDSCCGGDTVLGLQLFHALKDKVTVTVTGRCVSAGILVMLAGSSIKMASDARLMIHSPVQHCVGNVSQLRAAADGLQKVVAEVQAIIAERTGQSAGSVCDWLSRDTWFTAEEAKAFGLVDLVFEATEAIAPAKLAEAMEPTTTPEERFFFSLLKAVRPLPVVDKQNFCRELNAWCVQNVKPL